MLSKIIPSALVLALSFPAFADKTPAYLWDQKGQVCRVFKHGFYGGHVKKSHCQSQTRYRYVWKAQFQKCRLYDGTHDIRRAERTHCKDQTDYHKNWSRAQQACILFDGRYSVKSLPAGECD